MAASELIEDHSVEFEDNEDDIDDQSHKKLLNAVSQIYRKQRISAPKRNEPFQQISEFNLTKSDRKKKLGANDLLKDLNKKATHSQITKKIESIRMKVKPLPKPLEKSEEEKLTRQVGFKAVEQQLWKWEALIQRNRAADQLVFPLKDETFTFERNADFLSTFTKPSELELKMAEAMKKSLLIQEGKADEEIDEKMTLEELFIRRNMVAKMRARESYRIAKAVRQNKIKSKKYHRLLKREKIKKELKEFELLQKTDPEAALAKLERVEKARAEERISLRHRNTGKWAKGLALRAKYDTEARAELADNLRKSREITAKLKSSIATDSEDDDDDDVDLHMADKSAENPWVAGGEVASFVSGYRKFWENQNKQKGESSGKDAISVGGATSEFVDESSDVPAVGSTELSNGAVDAESHIDVKNKEPTLTFSGNNILEKEVSVSEDKSGDESILGMEEPDGEKESDSKNTGEISAIADASNNFVEDGEETNMGINSSTKDCKSTPRSKRKKRKSRVSTCLDKSGTWSIVEMESSDGVIKNGGDSETHGSNTQKKTLGNKSKRKSLNTSESSSTASGNKVEEKLLVDKKRLNDMFDEVEMSIEETLPKRIAEIADLKNPKHKKPELVAGRARGKKSNHTDLSFKKSNRSELDESLIEMSGDASGISSGMNDIHKLVDRLGNSAAPKETALPDIDPEKFIPVKRQKLNTAIPDFEEGGDSESDDDKDEQHLNLMEAFADDDIADEFRKEKEEEEEDFKEKEIDLSLPGWGSWGGSGIVKKKKNKRVVKFPKIPRKDANRNTVIINEEPSVKFTKLKVCDLPPQYNSVNAYEAAIRAPIGDNWVAQSAHNSLIAPQVITKMGAIIEPLDASVLLKKEEEVKEVKSKNNTRGRKRFGKKGGFKKPHNGPSLKVNKDRKGKKIRGKS